VNSKEKSENITFLSVKDLVVEYTSEGKVIHAVNGVSFDLMKGRTLGLVGETGAGKTTIAKSILRILPDKSANIRKGQVFLNGSDLLKFSEAQMYKIRGSKISMVFQDPMTALNPIMRVGNQIAEVISLHNKITQKEAMSKAIEMLEMVGIPSERHREYPHQFSGGMKQRVVIAMALACNPELLLADEPTTALDVTIQAQVLRMINKLKKEKNTSMILITHDFGIVAEVCDDVAVVYAGEIVEQGSKEDIFDHPSHPYTIGLFAAIPSLSGDVDKLNNIKGMPPNPTKLPIGCKFSPRCPYVTEECLIETIAVKEISKTHFCRCLKASKVEEVYHGSSN
jgi:peptide/nickel transport system ATP-binding protein